MSSRKRRQKIRILYHCIFLVALSSILSLITIYDMDKGGSVTVLSMLPILTIGVKFGYKWGIGSSMVFMAVQLFKGIVIDDVFVWCTSAGMVIVCVLFDYVVPFGILGLTAFARPKKGKRPDNNKIIITFAVILAARFFCHFMTGWTIWGVWDDGFVGAVLHSLAYNGSYMGIEFALTITATGLLLATRDYSRFITEW